MPPPTIAPESIRQRVGGPTYERGLAYFRDRAVRALDWDAATRTLTGEVRGSGRQVYLCTLRFAAEGQERLLMSARCSCPIGQDCKHTVATLLESGRGIVAPAVSQHPPASAPIPAAAVAPTWRSLLPAAAAPEAAPLALGVELRLRAAYDPQRWDPRPTAAATPRSLSRGAGELSIALRPLTRGARGGWIKGDASWDTVRRSSMRFGADVTRWFGDLQAIAQPATRSGFATTSEWIALDGSTSPLLWAHLGGMEALGIPVVSTHAQQRVSLASRGRADLVVDQVGGGLRVSARITVDDQELDAARVRPIGRAGLFAYTVDADPIHITLVPVALDEPLLPLLDRPEGLVVPREDADEFLREAYPRLARRAHIVAGDGFDPPPPSRPALRVSARFFDDRVSYALEWTYAALPPFAYAPAAHPERDGTTEAAIRRKVEAAWRDATDLDFAAVGTHDDADTAEFAARVLPALERLDDVRVETTGPRPIYHELTGAAEIAVTTVETTDRDWFDLGILVTIDGRTIPLAPLLRALTRGAKRMKLSDGAYFALAHPSLERLKELLDEAAAMDEWETGDVRLSRYQTDLWADFEDLADEAAPAVAWREIVRGLRDEAGVVPTPPPSGLRAQLRPYQQAGFDWLAFLWRHKLGGILADDMGLGKTLQALALIAHAREEGETRPFLVVAPTSLLGTWAAEATRFVPDLAVRIVDGTRAKSGAPVAEVAASAGLVVTSYTLLRLDEQEFGGTRWAGVVLDEAQFVKNPQTRAHRAAKKLRADTVIAVTGTPLENGLGDLWALLSLTAPGLFPSFRRFREEYVAPIEHGKVPENVEGGPYRAARLQRLRARIRPLVLRRTKEIVAGDLPPKQEQDLNVELSPAHRTLYDTVLQRERQKVLGLLADLDRNRFIVFRSLTLLRMLSLAPELVDEKYARLGSSKLDALIAHIVELAAEGHRALVFSQFTSFLRLAASRLEAAGIAHAYLDGSTRNRPEVIDGFRGGDAPVFLISLKAGGFGLTLTEADYVFVLDPWWNPAAEAQAVDRTHRIGQDQSVFVYRLLSAGTIEQKVRELQERKGRLFRSVMDDGDLFAQSLTAEDIRGLFDA